MNRIAIDAAGIQAYGGVRTSILNLLQGLCQIDPTNQYLVLLSQYEPSLSTPVGNIQQVVTPIKNRFLLRFWVQLQLTKHSEELNLVHFPKSLGVFGLKIPTVVTIHDLAMLIRPELYPRIDVWYWKTMQAKTLSSARRVITVSHTVGEDVQKFYRIAPERIQVIYNAIGDHFKPQQPSETLRVRKKYHLPQDYLIYVGRIDRKKNLGYLVQAFHQVAKHHPDLKLVLVGEIYQKSPDLDLQPAIERLHLQEKVCLTGKVPDQDLPALFGGALAAVYPSHYEGFGIPQIEAMACGTPVVSSSAGAIREVSSNAAYIVETTNEEAFARAVLQVISDQDLRKELVQRGLERAEAFRGPHAARQTLQLYQEVIQESSHVG